MTNNTVQPFVGDFTFADVFENVDISNLPIVVTDYLQYIA